ncbi:MAG TPA: PAS domain-containing protein, partial [Allosphingosinicella sp.]
MARFSGLGEAKAGDQGVPSTLALLAFDFGAPASDIAGAIAADRARAVAAAVPLLAGSHLLWACIVAWRLLASDSPFASPAFLLLAALLAVDALGWALAVRARAAPARLVQLVAAQVLLTGGLWAAAAAFTAGIPGGASPAVVAALLCGAGSGLALFFPVPALAAASCALVWATAAAVGLDPELLGIGAALVLILCLVSLFRARDAVLGAERRLSAEAEAETAGRFVEEYEASGRGWFWETNSEGAVTYASEQLAARLGLTRGAMIGRRFEDLLFAEEAGNPLGFHLSARFPFTEVIVRAPGAQETWWALSGSPNFDRYGRFLGFRGLGVNLSEQQRGEA